MELRARILCVVACVFILTQPVLGQSAQVGADTKANVSQKLAVEYVHYRPARWDTEHITEYESEHPNQGGLLYFYVTNTSPEPVSLRFWRYNNRDESYWLLNHFIAWHRLLDNDLDPGETTVLEVAAISRDFQSELPFIFEMVDDSWEPCVKFEGHLREDVVNVSFIHVHPDMKTIDVHVRKSGGPPIELTQVELPGSNVTNTEWRGQKLGREGQAIARLTLSESIRPGLQLMTKIGLKAGETARTVYAHRRAFPDYFPIGTWGIDEHEQAFVSGDHVDTGVKGGSKSDAFFGGAAARFGLNAMVHTGEPVNVDMVRDLSGHPNVACWMLRDEPDWSVDPQVVLFCDTTVKAYDQTKPTFVNLCRNVKFFEYAAIADIAGHDHYCVTAPSSSKWPHTYGTRLEETAFYTSDLKYAAEPRPIWVWSQGNHDGWGERPARPVPTPEELSAQLVLNLGRGAKGILWFTYNIKMSVEYPETRESMRGWNRVMSLLGDDFLAAEPLQGAIDAPDKVDVSVLVSWDKAIVCVTNLDYEIDPKAYPFRPKSSVKIALELPDWIETKSASLVSGSGVASVPCAQRDDKTVLKLNKLVDGAIVVLANDSSLNSTLQNKYRTLRETENDAIPTSH